MSFFAWTFFNFLAHSVPDRILPPIKNFAFLLYSDFAKSSNNAGLGQRSLKLLFNKSRRQGLNKHYIGIHHNTLEKYIAREKNIRLEKNNKYISNQEKLRNETAVHKNENSKTIFKCAICDQTFNQKQDLKSHTKNVHRFQIEFLKSNNKCTICDKKFKQSQDLESHIKKIRLLYD